MSEGDNKETLFVKEGVEINDTEVTEEVAVRVARELQTDFFLNTGGHSEKFPEKSHNRRISALASLEQGPNCSLLSAPTQPTHGRFTHDRHHRGPWRAHSGDSAVLLRVRNIPLERFRLQLRLLWPF